MKTESPSVAHASPVASRARWSVSAARGVFVAAFPLLIVTEGARARAEGETRAQAPATVDARGLAVLALAGAERAAWSLAQEVYARDPLRPSRLDEAHARVLAGASPPPPPASTDAGAPADLRDLADTRAAVHGDDAPSRALLASIANTFRVRGIVVVEMSAAARPVVRVFSSDTGAFDAARYSPDDGDDRDDPARPPRWTQTVTSLARAWSPPAAAVPPSPSLSPSAPSISRATPLAPVPQVPRAAAPQGDGSAHTTSGAFYTSPWFWGAVGAAAFGGAAVYFATRDNGDGTIHLQVQVPK